MSEKSCGETKNDDQEGLGRKTRSSVWKLLSLKSDGDQQALLLEDLGKDEVVPDEMDRNQWSQLIRDLQSVKKAREVRQ